MFTEAAWELGRREPREKPPVWNAMHVAPLLSAGGRKGHNPEILRQIAQELFD